MQFTLDWLRAIATFLHTRLQDLRLPLSGLATGQVWRHLDRGIWFDVSKTENQQSRLQTRQAHQRHRGVIPQTLGLHVLPQRYSHHRGPHGPSFWNANERQGQLRYHRGGQATDVLRTVRHFKQFLYLSISVWFSLSVYFEWHVVLGICLDVVTLKLHILL